MINKTGNMYYNYNSVCTMYYANTYMYANLHSNDNAEYFVYFHKYEALSVYIIFSTP